MPPLGGLMNGVYMRPRVVSCVNFRATQFWVQTLWPLSIYVMIEKLYTLSEPQFLHLKQRNNKAHFMELW